jgi:condensin complex subunit 1
MFSIGKQNDSDGKTEGIKEPDDLEMIGGTSEDDFSEGIALVRYFVCCELIDINREKELLFGSQSLLAQFSPLLVEVCSKPELYKVCQSSFEVANQCRITDYRRPQHWL